MKAAKRFDLMALINAVGADAPGQLDGPQERPRGRRRTRPAHPAGEPRTGSRHTFTGPDGGVIEVDVWEVTSETADAYCREGTWSRFELGGGMVKLVRICFAGRPGPLSS